MNVRTFPARAREFFNGCCNRFGIPASQKRIPEPGEPCPVREHGPAPVLSEKNLYARICSLPGSMGDRTVRGNLLIAASVSATFVTGYIALFVAIPIPAIAVSGAVSVAFLYLTSAALRCRSRSGTTDAEHERTAPVSGSAGLSARLRTIPPRMGSRTLTGDLLIAGSGMAAAATGYIALFAYIPVAVIALSGAVSLALVVLTILALRCRFSDPGPGCVTAPQAPEQPPAAAPERHAGQVHATASDIPSRKRGPPGRSTSTGSKLPMCMSRSSVGETWASRS